MNRSLQPRPRKIPQRRAAFTRTTATSTAAITRTPQSSSERDNQNAARQPRRESWMSAHSWLLCRARHKSQIRTRFLCRAPSPPEDVDAGQRPRVVIIDPA
jgi:hypothetical protein